MYDLLEAFNELNDIQEDFEKMLTEAQVKTIFNKCVKNCNTIPELQIDNAVFGGIKAKGESFGDSGACEIEYKDHAFINIITIKDRLCYKSAMKYLLSTIYHELAHAIVNNQLIKSKDIIYDRRQDIVGWSVYCDNNLYKDFEAKLGHIGTWTKIADIMNIKFNLEVPITALASTEEEEFLNSINRNTGTAYTDLDNVETPGIIIGGCDCDWEYYNYNTLKEVKSNPSLFRVVKNILLTDNAKCHRCGDRIYLDFQQQDGDDNFGKEYTRDEFDARYNMWKEKVKNM